MKCSNFVYAIALGVYGAVSASTNSTLDTFVATANANIMEILEARTSNASATCTSENVVIRREWSVLTSTEKTDYIAAVQCMMKTTAITLLSATPGVRSRFDDFGALHINQTSIIHWTTIFYTWHRYYTWQYEQVLIKECGYTGTQPYWDWSSTDTIAAHSLFDGSETSIGGNGAALVDHSCYVLIPTPSVTNATIKCGTGGGCIESGPFANVTVNLGPHGSPVSDGLNYNPRCLTRDFRDWILQEYLSYDNVTTVMLQPDLPSYETIIEGSRFQDGLWASAQDPSFVFHHAQIDRVWSIWQALNQTVRTQEISGTLTIKNLPPPANGTLDSIVDLDYVVDPTTIRELASTIDGPFCHIYA